MVLIDKFTGRVCIQQSNGKFLIQGTKYSIRVWRQEIGKRFEVVTTKPSDITTTDDFNWSQWETAANTQK